MAAGECAGGGGEGVDAVETVAVRGLGVVFAGDDGGDAGDVDDGVEGVAVGFCEGYAGYADDEVVGAGGAADGGFADCEGGEGGGGGGWGWGVGGDAVVDG